MVSVLCFLVVFVGSIKKRPVVVESSAQADEYLHPESAAFDSEVSDESCQSEVTAIFADGKRLVIGTVGGLYVMPFNNSKKIPREPVTPEAREINGDMLCLNSILPLGEYRYAGGFGLYKLDSSYTMNLESSYPGETVNVMMEFADGLLVGTDRGLWFHCNEPFDETGCADTLLKSGIIVTALATDNNGLWVGTYGDGLYYFDGCTWQERYLKRDTFAFAFVNAIEYAAPYLWVGTDNGIWRYNGGKWAEMNVADSSENYMVSSILTTPAATYIGTERGLFRYTDSLRFVDSYEEMAIAGLCVSERGVIVATRNNGIFTYNGKEKIVSPEQLTAIIEVSAGTRQFSEVTK
jgi:ligand-binding sensor domain-containing protein